MGKHEAAEHHRRARARQQAAAILDPVDAPTRPLEAQFIEALGVQAPASFRPHRILTAAVLADTAPTDPADLELYRVATGGRAWPMTRSREVWILCGRASGKSWWAACMAVALAACFDRARYPGLQPGETVVVLLLASDRAQATVLRDYILALLLGDRALAAMILGTPTVDEIRLVNGVAIMIGTSSYRWTRGRLYLGVFADETSFWDRTAVANPDTEVLNAIMPGLRLRESLFVATTTTYRRQGATFEAHERFFGREGSVFVWKSDTLTMNPCFDRALVEAALARDPAAARAEYFSEFRSDVEGVFTREMLLPLVDQGVTERAPDPASVGAIFVDEAGGGVGEKADSFAAAQATAYLDDGRLCARLDWLLEIRPPFRHDEALARVAERAHAAGLDYITGDKFGGQYPAQEAAQHGLGYVASTRSRSDLYLALIPLVTSERVRLLDHAKLLAQLTGLERTPGTSGRDRIDHGRTVASHDDLANVTAGAVLAALDAAEALVEIEAQSLSPAEAAQLRTFEREWGQPMVPPGGYSNLALDDDGQPIDRRYGTMWPSEPRDDGYLDVR